MMFKLYFHTPHKCLLSQWNLYKGIEFPRKRDPVSFPFNLILTFNSHPSLVAGAKPSTKGRHNCGSPDYPCLQEIIPRESNVHSVTRQWGKSLLDSLIYQPNIGSLCINKIIKYHVQGKEGEYLVPPLILFQTQPNIR